MEETSASELTFGEIVRMILKRIWYVLGASVAVTLIAVLVVHFAVNPAVRSYSMEFNLVFPTGKEQSYPDGEPFFYQEIVSLGYLNEAKQAEGLASVDVENMKKNDDIEIYAAETDEKDPAGRYTVRVKSKYFSGEAQAEAFIRALAQVPVDKMRAEAAKVDYAVSEETFNTASFEERLSLLAQERADILDRYDAWIEAYDAAYMLSTGAEKEQSLKDLRASVIALYGESTQAELENELSLRGYYHGDLEAYKAALKQEYAQNKSAITALKEAGVTQGSTTVVVPPAEEKARDIVVETPNELSELIVRNNKILHWLGSAELGEEGSIEATLTGEAIAKFAERLEGERQKLQTAASTLTAVTEAIYSRGMSARFDVQNVEVSGGVGAVLTAIAAFVVAFLVACVIVCAVETSKKKKAAKAETPAEK